MQDADAPYIAKKNLWEIDGTDTLSANVPPCTFADGEFLLSKNSLLCITTDIRVRSEMSFGNRRC
ncbi:hypothetical protein, partial [Treponema sp.]|uniref:hypothetical protein n=1 Tax=Treponema sp. TaxID=166 RepID=UPI003FA1F71D